MARVDYDRQAEDYHAGRGVPLDHLAEWRAAVEPYVRRTNGPILDVGAGTGIWVRAFSTWFDVPVIAVEPSAGMRAKAISIGLPSNSSMAAGSGEALPIGTEVGGVAWLSTVIHHLIDLQAAANELHRVLRPGGSVLIRNSFPGRHDEIMLVRYFPAAKEVLERFPTVDEIEATFGLAGFNRGALERIHEPPPSSLTAFRDWAISMRCADSAFAPLADQEFAEGLQNIDDALDAGVTPTPLGVDLLTFDKP